MACAVDCDITHQEVLGSCDDVTVTIPELPSDFEDIEIPDASTVTEEVVTGNGIFDIYMRAGMNQLNVQYDQDRIKGANYAQAYIAMVELMMTEANKFALGVVQAEIAAKLFPMQFLGAQYDAAYKEAQSIKMKHESDLVCQQVAELKANGAVERTLKDKQAQTQVKQAELYTRQITSFTEKAANDAGKILLDAWAVQAVEEPLASDQISGLKATGANDVANHLKNLNFAV